MHDEYTDLETSMTAMFEVINLELVSPKNRRKEPLVAVCVLSKEGIADYTQSISGACPVEQDRIRNLMDAEIKLRYASALKKGLFFGLFKTKEFRSY